MAVENGVEEKNRCATKIYRESYTPGLDNENHVFHVRSDFESVSFHFRSRIIEIHRTRLYCTRKTCRRHVQRTRTYDRVFRRYWTAPPMFAPIGRPAAETRRYGPTRLGTNVYPVLFIIDGQLLPPSWSPIIDHGRRRWIALVGLFCSIRGAVCSTTVAGRVCSPKSAYNRKRTSSGHAPSLPPQLLRGAWKSKVSKIIRKSSFSSPRHNTRS